MARTRTSPTGTPGRRVALDGILVALAMIFSYIETFIPFNFGVPGIKLGLANLVVLLGLTFLPAVDVLLISVVRIVLSSLLFGNVMSLWYSLAGGLLSFLCMWLLTRREGYSIIGISMAGGEGGIYNLIVGIFIIGVLTNGMTILGISAYWQYVAQGAILAFSVGMDWYQRTHVKSKLVTSK